MLLLPVSGAINLGLVQILVAEFTQTVDIYWVTIGRLVQTLLVSSHCHHLEQINQAMSFHQQILQIILRPVILLRPILVIKSIVI